MAADVSQKENTVTGDMAAGDIHKTTVINQLPPKNPTRLQALQLQFEQDCNNKPQLKEFIDSIQHFLTSVDGPVIVGLAAKLTMGGRAEEIPVAEECKEQFYKLLTKNQFSNAAQQIYTFLLGRIYDSFIAYVYPLIEAKSDKAVVNAALYEKVLVPLHTQINDEGLHINPHELRGMLYFLTGNCHIWWK